MAKRKSVRGKIKLTGIAELANDGQIRITRGQNFNLYNGTKRVHTRMQERAIEFLAKVKQKGLSVDNISRGECRQILSEMGMIMDEDCFNVKI